MKKIQKMEYINAICYQNCSDYPTLLYSEVNEERFETRKIEVWKNGNVGFADDKNEINGTELGKVPIPSLTEINNQKGFKAEMITAEEFEIYWSKHVSIQ